jgi:hypothetical protein
VQCGCTPAGLELKQVLPCSPEHLPAGFAVVLDVPA